MLLSEALTYYIWGKCLFRGCALLSKWSMPVASRVLQKILSGRNLYYVIQHKENKVKHSYHCKPSFGLFWFIIIRILGLVFFMLHSKLLDGSAYICNVFDFKENCIFLVYSTVSIILQRNYLWEHLLFTINDFSAGFWEINISQIFCN